MMKLNFLMLPLKDQAVKCALESNWEKAVDINKTILEENPNDLDTLNRLGFSLLKCKKYDEAKSCFEAVINLDRTNPIAQKNLKKIQALRNSTNEESSEAISHSINGLFIQETGKTKAIELRNLADKKTLLGLETADEIQLAIKRSKIFAQKTNGTFIGMLPDDLGSRIIGFMKGGNEYKAYVMTADDKRVTIFIKEVKRSKKFSNQPTFSFQ